MQFFDKNKDKDQGRVVKVSLGENSKLSLMGLLTSTNPKIGTSDQDKVYAVYVPVSYQIGGYTIFVSPEQVEYVDISVEDKKLIDDLSKTIIKEFMVEYEKLTNLTKETLEPVIKSLIEKHNTNFKGVGQPLRIALVGSRFGPGLYDVILSLDKAEIVKRLSVI